MTEPGGTLYVICFRDDDPDTGPHPVDRDELRAAFDPSGGWRITTIEPELSHTRFHVAGAPAWLATVTRTASPAS